MPKVSGMIFETKQRMIRTGPSFVRIVADLGSFDELAVKSEDGGIQIEQKAGTGLG